MDKDLESNRITLSLGFITAFLTLFFGANFLSENKLIYGVKAYAFISSALFFFYLLFTAVSHKYKKEELGIVSVAYGKMQFTNEEIEKFRKWSFDAGTDCVFTAFFLPFYAWLFQYTDNIKTLFALILILFIFQFFFLTIKYFFKTSFIRSIIFAIITLALIGLTGFLNNAAKKITDTKNNAETGLILKQDILDSRSDVVLWPIIVHFVAVKNILSD